MQQASMHMPNLPAHWSHCVSSACSACQRWLQTLRRIASFKLLYPSCTYHDLHPHHANRYPH
ncbi:uncharacterized protein SCHCODRAFT_02270875 [Schizophyllum commune H4-8]|uniref:uncharacterized protein n=1 Tax=Schizophyllum commune (strain H4-8 / FGSC 9210) TaxID=578458 RepID=UPI00215FD884|nr:uncharacterized protein SCHCODRAFT_02270875 [Schizophyllum commune H4-8]KAI5894169.1 hypothetical protein SCHCODRAFT_02270875 [Schizophyllum commune H4-8]